MVLFTTFFLEHRGPQITTNPLLVHSAFLFSQFAEAHFRQDKELSSIFPILYTPPVANSPSSDLRGDYLWNSGITIHWIVLLERSIPSAASSEHLSVMTNSSNWQYVHEIVPSPS
jgi:hypothetical protein